MSQRSSLIAHSWPSARTLVQKADQAMIKGDRAGVTEFIGRLYNLLDWQVSLTQQLEDMLPAGRYPKAATGKLH